MDNLAQRITEFCTSDKLTKYNSLQKLYGEFHEAFPIESLATLSLERYALGYKDGSFSWWLEYKTSEFGSIKGGSASKHVIYFKKEEKEWSFPNQFETVEEAWNVLRNDILDVIKCANQENYEKVDSSNLLYSKSMLKGKISYVYTTHKMMPIFQVQHLKHFLSLFDITTEVENEKDCVVLSRRLREVIYKNPGMDQFDELLVGMYLYTHFSPDDKVYKIAPGENALNWARCKENNEISLGWDYVGDLTQYVDFKELRQAIEVHGQYASPSKITEKANEIWNFYQLKHGDIVVANKGTSKILAIGIVNDVGYQFKDYNQHRHTIGVDWGEGWEDGFTIPPQKKWAFKSIQPFSKSTLDRWLKRVVQLEEITEEERIDTDFFEEIDRALTRKGQAILYGPPGTGKTHTIQQFLKWFEQKHEVESAFCTFHPSFQYEDFIEGFKPIAGEHNTISFKLEKGIFKNFVETAQKNPQKKFVFIIDELNRGNIPKIFGELITLIEKDKRGLQLILPQSKHEFYIPNNVLLLCTMNTADRSIKAMDAAIKRRFAFVECMPNYELLNESIENLTVTPAQILKHINKQLMHLQGRDLQIGHAYFMSEGKVVTTISDLIDIFRYDIIPLLQEYCFDNYETLAQLIGNSFVDVENNELIQTVFSEEVFISAIDEHFQVDYEN